MSIRMVQIHGQNDAMVGGLIAKLKGGCHISDSYVGGEITVKWRDTGRCIRI